MQHILATRCCQPASMWWLLYAEPILTKLPVQSACICWGANGFCEQFARALAEPARLRLQSCLCAYIGLLYVSTAAIHCCLLYAQAVSQALSPTKRAPKEVTGCRTGTSCCWPPAPEGCSRMLPNEGSKTPCTAPLTVRFPGTSLAHLERQNSLTLPANRFEATCFHRSLQTGLMCCRCRFACRAYCEIAVSSRRSRVVTVGWPNRARNAE